MSSSKVLHQIRAHFSEEGEEGLDFNGLFKVEAQRVSVAAEVNFLPSYDIMYESFLQTEIAVLEGRRL